MLGSLGWRGGKHVDNFPKLNTYFIAIESYPHVGSLGGGQENMWITFLN